MPSVAKKICPSAVASALVAGAVERESFEYTIDRYYYTPQRRFEQSIDVYKPVCKKIPSDNNDITTQPQPIKTPVVLVMGSAWLGHKPYCYVMTNWWNSSAPKQICGRLGHPCVSIRHSGGFLCGNKDRSSFLGSRMQFLWAAAALAAIAAAKSTSLVVALLLWLALYWEGRGAAGIDDMVSDVSTALVYIDAHAREWGLGVAPATDANKHEKIPIVFGGYSSGAHVAATLLTASSLSPLASLSSTLDNSDKNSSLIPNQGPQQQQKLEHLTIRSVLYISGVLDVSPESWMMNLLSRVILGKPPSQVPSPLRVLRSYQHTSIHDDDNRTDNSNSNGNLDLLPQMSLPPHVLIGCKREVFGWSVLDSAFCASEYADTLRWHLSESHRKTPAGKNDSDGVDDVRLILLEGWAANHWSILSSAALRNTLRIILSTKASLKACD